MPRRPLPVDPIERQEERLRRRRAARFGIASMLVVMVALSLPDILATPSYRAHLVAGEAGQAPAALPDGSQIDLETGAALEVRYYKRHREATLADGAAQFRIARDPDRLFEAHAGLVVARTDDARFDMRRAGAAVRVEVRSGTVEVSEGRWYHRHSVVLQAGQGVQTQPAGGLTPVFIVGR
ncbi:FecR domain-containing protein [Achromobacter aloeverae]